MGYLFLTLALLCGATKGFCGKKISSYTAEYRSAMLANIIRMLLCIPIGFILVLFDGGLEALRLDLPLLLISLLSAVSTSAFVILWLFSVRRGAYMLVDVFLTLSILIPISLSAIFYDEVIRWNQIVGLLLLFVAVIFMCSYNNQIKAKINLSTLILLLVTAIASGISDFTMKIFVNNAAHSTPAAFSFYTFLFSAVILFVLYISTARGYQMQSPGAFLKGTWLYILIMAICLFGNSYFKTLSSEKLTAMQIYPISQGGGLILSSFISSFFFGEKIKPRLVIGIVTAFIGLLIINLL